MNLLSQQIAVVVIAAAAALFATWRLLSMRARLAVLEWATARVPATSKLGRWLETRVHSYRAAQGSGCSACAKKG